MIFAFEGVFLRSFPDNEYIFCHHRCRPLFFRCVYNLVVVEVVLLNMLRSEAAFAIKWTGNFCMSRFKQKLRTKKKASFMFHVSRQSVRNLDLGGFDLGFVVFLIITDMLTTKIGTSIPHRFFTFLNSTSTSTNDTSVSSGHLSLENFDKLTIVFRLFESR